MKRHSLGTVRLLKAFLKHFAKFTEKHLRKSPLYGKLAGIGLQLLFFFCKFCETLQNLKNTCKEFFLFISYSSYLGWYMPPLDTGRKRSSRRRVEDILEVL